MKQLHKKFTTEQAKDLLCKYDGEVIRREAVEQVFWIRKAQFFRLLKRYREREEKFSINYGRNYANRVTGKAIDKLLKRELEQNRSWIEDNQILI